MALDMDLNGSMDHAHDYFIIRKYDQGNLDNCDVHPKWLTVYKPVRT